MSLGGGGSNNKSSTTETALSTEQAGILKAREAQYQDLFFPALKQELLGSTGQDNVIAGMQPQVRQLNNVFASGENSFKKNIAQRGLTGSGFEAQGLASMSGMRSSALADAYFKAQEAARQRRLQLIQMGGAFSPQPTTAAPMGQKTSPGSSGTWGLTGENVMDAAGLAMAFL